MEAHQITPPLDDSNVRKRVCKACDRCRLKKSKCDGSSPCGRCRSDNAICVFGERKKSHDKVYPKGYVEMLEKQQLQLVNGLQELYKIAASGEGWEGPPLSLTGEGHPLTHDILNRLGVLHADNSYATFEDDLQAMQRSLAEESADRSSRLESPESDGSIEMNNNSGLKVTTSTQSHYPSTPFSVEQLPTPPLQSPQPSHTTFAAMRKPSFRPQSLQIHPGYTQWDTSMDPAVLNSFNWTDSPINYDPTFMPNDAFTTNFHTLPGAQQALFVSGDLLSTDVTMSSFTEDDFSAFLDERIS